MRRGSAASVGLALGCLIVASAHANSDPFSGIAAPGSAAVGAVVGAERSPYRGAGSRDDFLPLYLYEGEHAYLHSQSVGLKLGGGGAPRFEAFLRRRFENHPFENVPPALAGMAAREVGTDAGASVDIEGGWGRVWAEALHDVSHASEGSEIRFGYDYPWRRGRLWLRPQIMAGLRNARLNDYYYGVREAEATATRPAYQAASGTMLQVSLWSTYRLTQRWRLLAAASITYLPRTIGQSPIVEHRAVPSLSFGAAYDLSPAEPNWPEGKPLLVRAYAGASSDCDVLQIARLHCARIHEADNTNIAGVDVGRTLIARLHGWPLDVAGFVGLIRHFEAGLQSDLWQVNAYFKAYFYGFPWDERVRTRIGWGVGLSYAEHVPYAEVRDQAARGRNTSKLLNTFDPTIDVSLGDVIGERTLRDTYVGLGVSHRSGIFGNSALLGNVNGGSNYIYGYVETSF